MVLDARDPLLFFLFRVSCLPHAAIGIYDGVPHSVYF